VNTCGFGYVQLEVILGKYGVACIQREGSDAMKSIVASDILFKHLVSTKFSLACTYLLLMKPNQLQNNIHLVPTWVPNDVSSTRIRSLPRLASFSSDW
jgi:hypothetical protein